ncbi:hypothetical protein AVEN_205589-1 [Araneus ventricosus]|uniref:Uncharacterized protein n=1 Tax=Araneus ventricosus TaxID=182803 RepID=A0A4Y2F907_ARAVE|nr:hypothetical protein AVEN_205589-1 [Araneus ventricosus]
MVTQGELWETPRVSIKYRGCQTLDNMQRSTTGTLSSRGASSNTGSKRPFVVSVPISGSSNQNSGDCSLPVYVSSLLFSSLLQHLTFKSQGSG